MIIYTELKTWLSNQFSAKLGTYTFPGNLTTPAIRVDDGSNQEQPASVSGLEVVVRKGATDEAIATLDDQRLYSYTGTAHIFQWDSSQTAREHQLALINYLLGFKPSTGTFEPRLNEMVGVPRSTELNAIAEVRIPFRWWP